MSNLARKIEPRAVTQEVATVVSVDAGAYTVRLDTHEEYDAQRAVSCLIEPRAGDRVLVAVTPREGCFVLAVLRRDEPGAHQITVDGDLEVKLPAGRFVVAAQEGVNVVTPRDVNVVSHGATVRAQEASVVVRGLSLLGEVFQSEFEKVRAVAGTIDQVVERVSQKVKRSYRHVEEVDQVRAEKIDYAAKEVMNLRGGHTLMTADQLVKVDGAQVHLG